MATYYISASGCDKNDGLSPATPWQTIKKVNSDLQGGDTVCFKRGDTFFGQIRAPKNNDSGTPTTYKAYGEGTKPTVSQYKIAKRGVWENVGDGIWRIDLTDITKFDGNINELDTNVGFMKVDGRIRPKKYFALDKLAEQWDYYNDKQYVYVKSSDNPSEIASEIKFACNIINLPFVDNLWVEDIIFIGSGSHGISGTVNNATIKNCEFHELGGSELTTHFRPGVRYGNGVECWTDSSNVLVENCRFSNIFDVALTMQGHDVTSGWVNITFRGNVIWNCQQGFEIWSRGELENTGFQNCVFENNVCIDSGNSWGYDVRGNKQCSADLLIYDLGCPLCDIIVRNNTIYNPKVAPIFKSGGPANMPNDYKIEGNTFFINPKQDVIYRKNFPDEDYNAFYENLKKNNNVIETEFFMPNEI